MSVITVCDGHFEEVLFEGEAEHIYGKKHRKVWKYQYDGDHYLTYDPDELGYWYNKLIDNGVYSERDVDEYDLKVLQAYSSSDSEIIKADDCKNSAGEGIPVLCRKFAHWSLNFGKPYFDLLTLTLIRDDKAMAVLSEDKKPFKLKGNLYGFIKSQVIRQNDQPQTFYFRVKRETAISIDLTIYKAVALPLSSPCPQVPSRIDDLLFVAALMLDDDYLLKADTHDKSDVQYENNDSYEENSDLFGVGRKVRARYVEGGKRFTFSGGSGDGILRSVLCAPRPDDDPYCWRTTCSTCPNGAMDSPIKIVAEFASYSSALIANVMVFINSPSCSDDISPHIRGIGHCSTIVARPCVLSRYTYLLTDDLFNESFIEVKPGQPIQLTRSSLAIPSYSSLVIDAQLFDQDGCSLFNDLVFFPARPPGSEESRNVNSFINIVVKWSV